MKTNFSIIFISALLAGCALRAPDVSVNKGTKPILTDEELGVSQLCEESESRSGNCGSVSVNLRLQDGEDRWVYWSAGSTPLNYNAEPSYVASMSWDMRITKRFPIVGSNGGRTAQDIGHPNGKAAFLLWSEDSTAARPRNAASVAELSFTDDVYQGLEFGGVTLGAEYQNPTLNNIGPGIVRSYNMRDHSVELSQRIFILRSVSGDDFYAIRFRYYSRTEAVLIFDWRKL